MVAQALRRTGLTAGIAAVAMALFATGIASAAEANDGTSFLDGAELAQRLLHGVARVAQPDGGEHGFGVVVGGDARSLFVVTARHVVAQAQAPIEVRLCAMPNAVLAAKSLVEFDRAEDDIAVLRVARPAGYLPPVRALAPPPQTRLRDETWLLGRNDECSVATITGAVSALRDARNNLRIDLPGVLGGSSGAPVITGWGIVGLVKDSDNVTVTAHSIAHLEERVRAHGVAIWLLADARNVPPTNPLAAQIDLAETLNLYLFGLRDLHALLQQRVVARKSFEEFVAKYNGGLNRFRDARDKYDGTLRRHWPEAVAPSWSALRERLWAVHLNFWRVNPQAREIYETERTPMTVREQMNAIEPEMAALENAIAQFLRSLGQQGTRNASSPQ